MMPRFDSDISLAEPVPEFSEYEIWRDGYNQAEKDQKAFLERERSFWDEGSHTYKLFTRLIESL